MPKPIENLNHLPPYLFAELDRKKAEAKARGVDIISLGVGDPDLPTPEAIVKAMQEAVAKPSNHQYPAYKGSESFLKSVSDWMQSRFGVSIDPGPEAIAVIGAKEGIAHLIVGYIKPGDVVLVPSPGYPVYHNYTVLMGGESHIMPLKTENNFLPDLDAIPEDVAKRAKLMFLNYPNNPTGAIIEEADIKRMLAFCRKHDILLCHDNAYSEMTYDGYRAPSFLSVDGAKEICLEMFSLSKMYNMTGWRIGFAVGNAEAVKTLGAIKNNTDSGAFTAVQDASEVVLKNSDELVAPLNEIYGRRRDIFVEGLQKLGWNYEKPAATFYLWVPVPTGMTSTDFANMMLDKCGVVVVPGNGYGPEGEGFFRVALTITEERMKEALGRMEKEGMTFQNLSKQTTPA